MASSRRLVLAAMVLAASLAAGAPAANTRTTLDLLDSYASGQFAAVVEYLQGEISYDDILKDLRRDGPAWIEAAAPAARATRELAAATFALEAARAGAWHEWKIIKKQPPMCADVSVTPNAVMGGGCIQPPNVFSWQAPPLLIEWGCALLRTHPPGPVERWWQLAALAVAQRSEDAQFLVGDPGIGLGIGAGEIANVDDEIKHLEHALARFPDEHRFKLAEAIAYEAGYPGQAPRAYRALAADPDVGAEALLRLGVLQMPGRRATIMSAEDAAALRRLHSADDALESFEQALAATRDPFVVFLAHYFTAQIHERANRQDRARTAYRAALDAVPGAQSATTAFAALLYQEGRRAEAQALVTGMFALQPPPVDPWRAMVHADDRFWRRLVGRLREEILR